VIVMNLGVCIEGIRRALVYGRDMLEYKEHPRSIRKERTKIATEGFLEAIRAIAENCPLPKYRKEDLLEKYERLKESPWQTVAEYGFTEAEVYSTISDVLIYLRDYLGFSHEDYEEYIPP